jgi:formate dehydrogenase iron-sulfur subunit
VRSFTTTKGGLLPALHALQHAAGYIDRDTIPELADAFNITVAEVHGVITFYKDFRTTKPAGPIVHVCRAEACQARGGRDVWERAQEKGAGKAVEIEEVFCLGHCALGPAVAVDGNLHGGVTTKTIDTIIGNAIARKPAVASIDSCGSGVTVYVPRDAASRAAGADEVASLLAAVDGVRLVRNGSWGMMWLEPMIEVVVDGTRIAYGPVQASDVPKLLKAGLLTGGDHKLRLGPTAELPWLKRQDRVTFQRVGVVDPRSADDYEAHRGIAGLQRALTMSPSVVVQEVTDSGLRGRGGAAFPTGIKWKTVLETESSTKYIVCNADEGDSGTFADRMLMEGDPFMLLEGMTIAGFAVGASEGYIYVRSEYPEAIAALNAAITSALAKGWLGNNVLGSGFSFNIQVRVGAGSYVCGEETALLESIEGKRGVVRAKPPLPAHVGLFGQPTVVNNVLSLGTVPAILADGAAAYAAHGVGRSRGTQVVQLAGNIARGGIFETAFGTTLGEVVNDLGGGTANGRPIRAVQVGGPLGAYIPTTQFDLPFDYEAFAAADAIVGHGGIVVFDDTVDMAAQARFAMEFCAIESCGKCTPCRIGSTRGVELIDKITAGVDRSANIEVLVDLCEVMADGSLCAMGGLTPLPVRSALNNFTEDFHRSVGAKK